MNTETNNNAVTVSAATTPAEKYDPQKVDTYAKKIQQVIGKAQAAVLELAFTVADAKKNLNEKEWFLIEEKFGSGAQLSKYLRIGKSFTVLQRHKDNLPSSMVSLYQIASKLNEQQIEKCVEANEINRLSTNKDLAKVISRVLGKPEKPKSLSLEKIEFDPSANVVALIINTNESSISEMKRKRPTYEAALRSIQRGIDDLRLMGFSISKDRIKGIDSLMTIPATAKAVA